MSTSGYRAKASSSSLLMDNIIAGVTHAVHPSDDDGGGSSSPTAEWEDNLLKKILRDDTFETGDESLSRASVLLCF